MSKARQQVKAAAAKEAEKIFMKTASNVKMKDGSWPKVGKSGSSAYDRAGRAIEKQVMKTRLSQFKKSK